MAKQTIIKESDLVSRAEACKLLGNVSITTLLKYIRSGAIRRVKDKTKQTVSFIYKPDIDAFLSSRFYFEGE